MEVSAEGKLVTMRFEGGDTFTMKTEGQDTTTGYPTLREAIQRTFPTLVRLSQLTKPDCIYGIENRGKDKTADELEQWRDNSSTDDTLTSQTRRNIERKYSTA